MIPPSDQTGVFHFHSSITSGSAAWISARSCARSSPLQSPNCLIFASIRAAGDSPAPADADFAEGAFLADGGARVLGIGAFMCDVARTDRVKGWCRHGTRANRPASMPSRINDEAHQVRA